jgi:PAS domain S-box-containing protein
MPRTAACRGGMFAGGTTHANTLRGWWWFSGKAMKVESEQLLTKTLQGINASRSGVGLSPKAYAVLKLIDATMAVSALQRLCLEESIAEADFHAALKELMQFEHLRVGDDAASAKAKPVAVEENERKMLLTLDFTPWTTAERAKVAGAVQSSAASPARPASAIPATAANRAPPPPVNAANAAGAVAASPLSSPAGQPPAPALDARDDRAARLRQESEVRQKLIAALQPRVEEELRARLRPKLEQELRPKLIASLRLGLEAEVRAALTRELTPRVELELKARMAKSMVAQKVADQQTMRAEPVIARAAPVVQTAADNAGAGCAEQAEHATHVGRVWASLNLPVFSVDKTGVCSYMSPAWVQFSGYTAAETVGKPLMDFFAERDRRAIVSMLTGIANGSALRFEQQGALLRKGGDPLWVEISAAPLYAAGGEAVGVCGAIRDAAESRRTADQAEADGVRLLLLVDQIDTGVLLEDGDGNIQQANPALCTLLSLDAAPYSLEGMPVTELHATAAPGFIAPDGFLQRVAEIRAAGEDSKGESFVTADGRVIAQDYLQVTAGNSVVGHLWLYRDMPRPQARLAP